MQSVYNGSRLCRPSLDLEGEDAAGTSGEVALVQVMCHAAWQTGMVDAFHLGMSLEKIHNGQGVLYMPSSSVDVRQKMSFLKKHHRDIMRQPLDRPLAFMNIAQQKSVRALPITE